MRDIVGHLDRWAAAGEPSATATVVSVRRSAPRPPGAKMAVAAGGEVQGMVAGGCVEAAVVTAAEEVLGGGPSRLLHFGIADEEAWEVGMLCGGEIAVWVDRVDGAPVDRFARLARDGGRGALVTRLDDGRKLLVDADGERTGSLGGPLLDDAAAVAAGEQMWAERSERRELADVPVFVDATAPPPRLVIFGAVDLAAALCTFARTLGWLPYVVDPRGRFAGGGRFPDAEAVIVRWPQEALALLGGLDRSTAVAVLTHDPKLDDPALALALRSDAGFVGAIGSRRTQARRRERLRELGLSEAELGRLAGPIGLDLGALSVAETALSIVAEIVALRHDRAGGRLRDARGRIHEVEG